MRRTARARDQRSHAPARQADLLSVPPWRWPRCNEKRNGAHHHLRPSLLQVYVRNPAVPTGAIFLERLAAVSGSTLTALTHALVGLPRPRRHALNSPTQDPPPHKRINRGAPVLDPIRDTIDSLHHQNRTAWEIWTHVVDEHDSDASYMIIHEYIRKRASGWIR